MNKRNRFLFPLLFVSASVTGALVAQKPSPDIVFEHIDRNGADVEFLDDVYGGDEKLTLCVDERYRGDSIVVSVDNAVIGEFSVTDRGAIEVALPKPVRDGGTVTVTDSHGELITMSVAIARTYARGNIVHVGAYGATAPGIDDVVYLYNFLFANGPQPPSHDIADVDGSGKIDVDDLLVLYDYVIGGTTATLPRMDILNNGLMTATRHYDTSLANGWGRGITCPPRKGDGSEKHDLDGNPKTPEWTFPCTMGPVAGLPNYYTMITAWGPRGRNQGRRPTGGNSAFIKMLYCVVAGPTGAPVVQRKPIGKCVWPRGQNSESVRNGHLIWVSRDPVSGKAYEFDFDPATCKITIRKDNDANGSFETPVYSGNPSGWSGWPSGV